MQFLSSIYPSKGGQPPEPEDRDVNILVVEDTRAHRMIIKRVLSAYDLSVDFVNDGRAAIEYLKEHDPDICIIDWNMPYKNGGEVMQVVREDNGRRKRKSPVFIVLTTSDTEANKRAAYAAGANAYLVKPLELDDLAETLDNTRRFWFQSGIRLPKREYNE